MLEKIREIVAGYMGMRVSEIKDEQSFIEMSMDSLTLLKIIIEVENTFGVRIENDEIVEIRTIIDIFNLVEKKIS
ncbi:MAG: acyl carrier protein [Clostridia bacterium]|nr:acyl carrier protein [Clostridia bacterium]